MESSAKGVKRQRVCPSSLCIYELASSDLASLNEAGSAVLEAPPVVLFSPPAGAAAAQAETAPVEATAVESLTTQPSEPKPPLERIIAPTLVLPVWSDTTICEITMALLKRIRDSVDSAYEEKHKEREALEGERDRARQARPQTDRLPLYRIVWTAGYVSTAGKATMVPVGTVEVRQVVQGSGALFPVKRRENLSYTKTLAEIGYELGEPFFFTCVRV
ncbi:hypothetical protein STCU_04494 [Strigomonas culicis]|uniref:Uncharacterized protein n=1 Tax=Strigomonas culicis TaxID=28005 RepID=S9UFD4_9TRYP|nr:hypothetical protein STCU_04494 [Strigomonas culicis]|eukprot:EPY29527.1 hypothetical protein STCU_04494 [Strigomonas culicis]